MSEIAEEQVTEAEATAKLPMWFVLTLFAFVGLASGMLGSISVNASLAAARAGSMQWSIATIKADVKAIRGDVSALASSRVSEVRDPDLIAETGQCSRDWNEQEFVAKQIADADGKQWRDLPNVSTLWFKDKLHYRHLASRALSAKRLWDAHRAYKDAITPTPEPS